MEGEDCEAVTDECTQHEHDWYSSLAASQCLKHHCFLCLHLKLNTSFKLYSPIPHPKLLLVFAQ